MQLHLFGATTATGTAFCDLALKYYPSCEIFVYSRSSGPHLVDFDDSLSFQPAGNIAAPSVWISFAPIWKFAPFFEQFVLNHPERLGNLLGVLVCSSSSSITKRFAFNPFDRELVAQLKYSEDLIIRCCRTLETPCHVLQPTLIYGCVGSYSDRNLTILLTLLRRLPFLFLPSASGYRQPIHSTQLAEVSLHLIDQFFQHTPSSAFPELIQLGGDTTLTYLAMILSIQAAQPNNDPAHRCRIILIPNRLFFLLTSCVLLVSPKLYEAILRMGSNLSGFTTVHELLRTDPKVFPVQPFG